MESVTSSVKTVSFSTHASTSARSEKCCTIEQMGVQSNYSFCFNQLLEQDIDMKFVNLLCKTAQDKKSTRDKNVANGMGFH